MTPQMSLLTPLRKNQMTHPLGLQLLAKNSKDSHARIIAEAVSRDRDVKRRRWYTSQKRRHLREDAVPPTKPRWMKMRKKYSPRLREGIGGGIWRRKMVMMLGMLPSSAAEHKVVVKDRVEETMMSLSTRMVMVKTPDHRPAGDRRVNVVDSKTPRIDLRPQGEARTRNRAMKPREKPNFKRRETR